MTRWKAATLLLLIVDATAKFGAGDKFVLDIVKKSGQPCFLLLNKIDALDKAEAAAAHRGI